jgi:hypothetical protein
MPEVKDFVAALSRAVKVIKKPKILTDQAYCNKSLKRTQVYQIYNKN